MKKQISVLEGALLLLLALSLVANMVLASRPQETASVSGPETTPIGVGDYIDLYAERKDLLDQVDELNQQLQDAKARIDYYYTQSDGFYQKFDDYRIITQYALSFLPIEGLQELTLCPSWPAHVLRLDDGSGWYEYDLCLNTEALADYIQQLPQEQQSPEWASYPIFLSDQQREEAAKTCVANCGFATVNEWPDEENGATQGSAAD